MAIIVREEKSAEFKAMEVALKALGTNEAKVGWFPSSVYNDEHSTPVAAIAAQNEYGNPNLHIPARPFMRPTVLNKQNEWRTLAERGVKSVLSGKTGMEELLQLIAEKAVADIRKGIEAVHSPVLRPATIQNRLDRYKHKGRLTKSQAVSISKPLEDTGYMKATLSYELSSKS